jgi:hypothetical protein
VSAYAVTWIGLLDCQLPWCAPHAALRPIQQPHFQLAPEVLVYHGMVGVYSMGLAQSHGHTGVTRTPCDSWLTWHMQGTLLHQCSVEKLTRRSPCTTKQGYAMWPLSAPEQLSSSDHWHLTNQPASAVCCGNMRSTTAMAHVMYV